MVADVPPEDFQQAQAWASAPEASPDFVRNVILALQDAKEAGEGGAASARRAVEALARAMGIIPSSEKTPKAAPRDAVPVDEILARLLDDQAKLKALERYVSRELAKRRKEIAELMARPRLAPAHDGADEEGPSRELVLAGGTPSCHNGEHSSAPAPAQEETMADDAIETPTETLRRDFCLIRKDWTLRGKKIYDPKKDLTLLPDLSDVGPAGWNVTWRSMVNVIVLVFGMAVPGARIERLLGKDGFSRTNISDMCAYVATRLLPVYIELCRQLAQAEIIIGDDCVSRVNDVGRHFRTLREWKRARKAAADPIAFEKETPKPEAPWDNPPQDSLTARLKDELDFEFQHVRASKAKTPKIRLHTSLLCAQMITGNEKSRIVIYRTHLGSVGNLLGRVLLSRKRNASPLTFVGDLSASNHVTDAEVLRHVAITYAGCASHARRPFKRHEAQDPENCLDALDAFRALFHVEELIEDGRTRDRLEIRQKYSQSIWNDLKTLCESMQEKWSPLTVLGEGVSYLLSNFDALTRYIHDERLPLSNDLSERLLRYEKLMDRSSFGRETIEGRARYDIIRSFWQSCVAAGVDPTCSGSRMEPPRAREQRIVLLELNANDRTPRAHIICEWAHSQIPVLANGSPRAHAICEQGLAVSSQDRSSRASVGCLERLASTAPTFPSRGQGRCLRIGRVREVARTAHRASRSAADLVSS
jgi:Transposase IS66 family